MDDETPGVGSVLVERYRLDELYREGAVSRVYVARDLLLDRDVAVKVIDGLGDEVTMGRALRAARLASRVDDPHVVRILDVAPGGPPFLVLELHRAAPLDIEAAEDRFAIAGDLLAALAALHALGVVHRDVRAENVLPTDQGLTFLTAAGMMEAARDPGLGRSPGPVAVEPRRRKNAPSPEQEQGLPADLRSDVFAAGMLLEDLIGGNAGPAVVAVLGKATADDPAVRFPDAIAMRAAMLDAQDADQTAPASPAPAAGRERRGGRAAVPLVAAGLVAVIGGLAVVAAIGVGPRTTAATDPPTPATQVATSPTAVPSTPTIGGDLVAAAATDTALEELLARPDLVATSQVEADLIDRLRRVNGEEGEERAAEAAEVMGLTMVAQTEGTARADLARLVYDALADEITVAGVVAFLERDLDGAGPDGRAFLQRLRDLDGLSGDERAWACAELYGWAAVGGREGALSLPVASAAIAALLPQLSVEGLIAYAEGDPDGAGAQSGRFAEQLRDLALVRGEERATATAELYRRAVSGGLSPRYARAATDVLLGELTLDGLIVLARDAEVAGSDGPGLVARLEELGDLEGEERTTAALALLDAVDDSAAKPTPGVEGPFVAAALAVLRPLTTAPGAEGS